MRPGAHFGHKHNEVAKVLSRGKQWQAKPRALLTADNGNGNDLGVFGLALWLPSEANRSTGFGNALSWQDETVIVLFWGCCLL